MYYIKTRPEFTGWRITRLRHYPTKTSVNRQDHHYESKMSKFGVTRARQVWLQKTKMTHSGTKYTKRIGRPAWLQPNEQEQPDYVCRTAVSLACRVAYLSLVPCPTYWDHVPHLDWLVSKVKPLQDRRFFSKLAFIPWRCRAHGRLSSRAVFDVNLTAHLGQVQVKLSLSSLPATPQQENCKSP